jgi:hypothetical protein
MSCDSPAQDRFTVPYPPNIHSLLSPARRPTVFRSHNPSIISINPHLNPAKTPSSSPLATKSSGSTTWLLRQSLSCCPYSACTVGLIPLRVCLLPRLLTSVDEPAGIGRSGACRVAWEWREWRLMLADKGCCCCCCWWLGIIRDWREMLDESGGSGFSARDWNERLALA